MIRLDGASLTLDTLIAIAVDGETVQVSPDARARVEASRAVVERAARGEAAVYGVNTGFGSLSDVRVPPESLGELQLNLLRSHAAGVGDPLPVPVVRAAMALRANVLAKGYSGIRPSTLDLLVSMLNAGVHPVVPARGSVGASGDLAPLAHLALVLVGEGEVLHAPGPPARARAAGPAGRMSGGAALRAAGLAPVTLEAKEGLALINGTQVSTAALAIAVAGAERLARAADIAAAMSIDALRGSIHPFEARVHEARPFPGQRASATNIEALVRESPINQSHAGCGKVQDAYALRCAAQVHGAARDAFDFARRTVEIEANAATDNPMVFADAGEMVSGGNFHGAPVALAADLVSMAVVPLATISERRADRLLTASQSGLPAFLTEHSGLHSGLMIAQVSAAALASELKSLAHPAGVDTIPTSAGKEDHVSMSMAAGLKAMRSVSLATRVVAIELVCACQGIDLLAPLVTSEALRSVHRVVRTRVPRLAADRPPAPDIEAVAELVESGELERAAGARLS